MRHANADAWELNVKAFIDHLVGRGLMDENKQLSSIQFGTEVFSSPGDARLDVTDYHVEIKPRSISQPVETKSD